MKLTEEQIAQNWRALIRKIDTNFEGKRKDQLKSMYESFAERMMLAPASGIEHFHNCFAGGYVDHVLRVMDCSEKLHDLWSSMGADMSNYTKEELMFCALNHDLGKVGDKENEYYVPKLMIAISLFQSICVDEFVFLCCYDCLCIIPVYDADSFLF